MILNMPVLLSRIRFGDANDPICKRYDRRTGSMLPSALTPEVGVAVLQWSFARIESNFCIPASCVEGAECVKVAVLSLPSKGGACFLCKVHKWGGKKSFLNFSIFQKTLEMIYR
jgi:hypothetical protein